MMCAGMALVTAARELWLHFGQHGQELAYLLTFLILLPGLSIFLHFGLFKVITAFWRYCGFECRPLFRTPLQARTVSEFWGKRWNLAFSHMTAIGVYRPLVRTIGAPGAAVAAFLFSGILHEVAISLPVMVGLGLPIAYFALQGLIVTIERKMEATGHPINANKWTGRAWVVFWIAILFHPWFLRGVIWPLIGLH